jgi:hypothetical protein
VATNTPVPTDTPLPPSATATACALPFADVPAAYWAYSYIRWAYCAHIVSGYADNTFRPAASVTRGQVAKMIVLAAGFPLTLPPGAPHFADVPPDSPFYLSVEVAGAHSVISGYADGTFRPGAGVTRAQLTKMMVQARGLVPVTPATPTFGDVPRSYWAYRYVETAAAQAIVGGYDCGGAGEPCPGRYFRPGSLSTRAQLTKLLYQAFALPGPIGPRP